MPERRSLSLMMTPMPFLVVSRSTESSISVSAQPLMAVKGVRSSWETEEIKSFFIFSFSCSSRAMALMASHSSPISSSLVFFRWVEKSPLEICSAILRTSSIGLMTELMK